MPSTERPRMELKAAMTEMAGRFAPAFPDIVAARSAAAPRRRRAFVPLAAACLCALALGLGAAVLGRLAPGAGERGSSIGLRARNARAGAAMVLGAEGPDSGDRAYGLQADLLGYIETLWSGEAEGEGDI